MSSKKVLLHIGFGNTVNRQDVKVIIQPNSAPIKRFIKQKREEGKLIDATMGKKIRAVLALGSGYIVLSAISVSSLILRVENE
jgi:regulator of extracellular matrix RemA (YlzA/DUF370 family)